MDPDDLDAALDIRIRSLGALSPDAQESWREMMRRALAEDLVVGSYLGTELVAMARINRYAQWWGGRSLPMGGVGGVAVAPEYRGQGVGRGLMLATLDRAAAAGFAVSALYPSTAAVYRDCGWEFAGVQPSVTVPCEALRALGTHRVTLRRAGADDAAEIVAAVRACHTSGRTSGPIDWSEEEVRNWLAEDEPFAYLSPDGFLAYHWEGSDLDVDELVAATPETARALWALVGSGSSIATNVTARLGPDNPLRLLASEPVVQPTATRHWMLRLVDVAAALTQRGYPDGINVELDFHLDDQQAPANTGGWRLSVAGGRAEVDKLEATPDGLHLQAGGMAALYAGVPLATLRVAGLATAGDPAADSTLDAVFASRPYLLDYF